MINFIPVFPLGLVVYPGEIVPLHIFEPRYRQLIHDCAAQKKPLGIPAVMQQQMQEMGTLVEVTEICKTYESGEMDIKVQGIQVFRILELVRDIPGKLYQGAIVSYPANQLTGSRDLMLKLLEQTRYLHQLLQVEKKFTRPDDQLLTYDIAHHLGMTLEQEYELLHLMQERQRQEYIRRHLKQAIDTLEEMNQLRRKIQLNGHFRNLKGFDI